MSEWVMCLSFPVTCLPSGKALKPPPADRRQQRAELRVGNIQGFPFFFCQTKKKKKTKEFCKPPFYEFKKHIFFFFFYIYYSLTRSDQPGEALAEIGRPNICC